MPTRPTNTHIPEEKEYPPVVVEAAKILKIGEATAWDLAQVGKLPGVTAVGSGYVFDKLVTLRTMATLPEQVQAALRRRFTEDRY